MKDWLETGDKFSQDFGMGILENAGHISKAEAEEKAHREYDRYQKQLADERTEVEKAYIEALAEMRRKIGGRVEK